jgi:hypothetical protein
LTLKTEQEVKDFLTSLEKQSKAIKEEALRICWFMRGGVNYDQAMLMSPTDRSAVEKIVKDNMEVAKKSGMPFF